MSVAYLEEAGGFVLSCKGLKVDKTLTVYYSRNMR